MQIKLIRLVLITVFLLFIPFVAMQFTHEVVWNLTDFIIAGVLLFSAGLTYELLARRKNSTKYKVTVGVAVLLVLILVWVQLAVGIFPIQENSQLRYSSIKYGLSFSYPATYLLNEFDIDGDTSHAHHAIVLIMKKDLPLPVGGEGPTAITVDLYQNTANKYTTEQWIRTARESNFSLSEGILASTTISNLPALSYRWDGLYHGTTIVSAKPDWIYAFTVTYFEMGDDIIQDFVKIRDSAEIDAN